MALVTTDRSIGSYFNSYILQRIERNKNFIAAITGQTGSGKSWAAIREGEILDPDFDIRNVCFTSKEFMDLVNGETKQLKKGSVIVFDEIQVTMSHLEYQSIQAKVLNYVLQTFRHRNFILFMTSPHFSFINASLRKLFHSRIETISIDVKQRLCTLKPMLIQTNQKTGVIYEKYLRVWHEDHGVTPLKRIKVSAPSSDLLKDYEAKKDQFTHDLNESISKDLKKLEVSEGKGKKPLTERQGEIVEDLLEGMVVPNIAEKRGISIQAVFFHIHQIEKKDVVIKPVKEGARVIRYRVEGYEPF